MKPTHANTYRKKTKTKMFKFIKKMAKILINGSSYEGTTVIVSNRIIIDGVDVTPVDKNIDITITGDVDRISVASCDSLHVTGNVGSLETVSGDPEIEGDVNGNINSVSGDVHVKGLVGGDVDTTSGNVTASSISGNVKTVSGNIRTR